jgi:hypothetical protein
VPLPFFADANAPLWHAAIGYEVSGIVGIVAVGGVVYLVARMLRRADGIDDTVSSVSEGARP